MLKQFAKTIVSLVATAGALCATSPSTFAQTATSSNIPINTIRLENTLDASARVRVGYLEVPDRNTTVSAFGGRMRRYDVHIARMIALSHRFYCAQPYQEGIEKVMTWEYRANNGRINMGVFNLPCTKVQQAVRTYGLGKAVPMKVETDGAKGVYNVSLLDIQGNAETERFLKFVQTITPER